LSGKVSEQEIKSLAQNNIPVVQNLIMYSYTPQTGVVTYILNGVSSIDKKI